MKKLFLFFSLLFFVAPLIAQDALLQNYPGEAKKNDARYLLVTKALRVLEQKYQAQTGEFVPMPDGIVKLVDDPEKFYRAYFRQNPDPRFDIKDIPDMEKGFMVTIGTPPRRIVTVLTRAHRWINALRDFEEERESGMDREAITLSVAKIAAALDHDLVYHIALGQTDELKGLEFEKASFQWFVDKHFLNQSAIEAQRYLTFLELLKQDVKNFMARLEKEK